MSGVKSISQAANKRDNINRFTILVKQSEGIETKVVARNGELSTLDLGASLFYQQDIGPQSTVINRLLVLLFFDDKVNLYTVLYRLTQT